MIVKTKQVFLFCLYAPTDHVGHQEKSCRRALVAYYRNRIRQIVLKTVIDSNVKIISINNIALLQYLYDAADENKITEFLEIVQLAGKSLSFIIENMMVIGKTKPTRIPIDRSPGR